VHPEDPPHVLDVFSWVDSHRCAIRRPQRFRRSEGAYRRSHINNVPVRDSRKSIVQWCVLLTDIDELNRARGGARPQQQSEADHRQDSGMGISLFVSRSIVARHGGDSGRSRMAATAPASRSLSHFYQTLSVATKSAR
jgi:hypothetical protein